jgi:hypothetical protein
MRSKSGRRFLLPFHYRHIYHDPAAISQATELQHLCEIFCLQDHIDVTWTFLKWEMV